MEQLETLILIVIAEAENYNGTGITAGHKRQRSIPSI
jgi:hypothetical protein